MKFNEFTLVRVVAVLMLLAAILPIPYYAYYQVMNWVVAGTALLTASQARGVGKAWMVWVFVPVAIIFNPVDALHLRTDVWQIADICAAVLFLASFFLVRAKGK